MKKNICALFDMDGVLLDTESQYDIFWHSMGEKYQLGIERFEKKIKGTTLVSILQNYFSHLPESEHDEIKRLLIDFERNMTYSDIPGAMQFVQVLKANGIKVGMVTSSDDEKLSAVFRQRVGFDRMFDTIVSANRIKQGKPHPMCYLLAAKDLGVDPADCYVFEDALSGIQAGTAAGMTVIGLATTNPVELIQDKVVKVIPHFEEFSVEDMKSISAR